MGNIYCNYTFSYYYSYSSFYKKDEIQQLGKQLLQAAGIVDNLIIGIKSIFYELENLMLYIVKFSRGMKIRQVFDAKNDIKIRRWISECVGKTNLSRWCKLIKMIFAVHHFRQQQQHQQWVWFLSRHHKLDHGLVRRWGHQFRRHREHRTRTGAQLMKGIEQVYSKVNSLSNPGIHGQSVKFLQKYTCKNGLGPLNSPWIPGRIYSFDEIDFLLFIIICKYN